MSLEDIRNKLKDKGLKVTPQRIAVLEAVDRLKNHPRVEQIMEYFKTNQPNISIATVYNVLDVLIEHNLVKRVNTEKNITRYDAIVEPHHHIYYSDSNTIQDYNDPELSALLKEYFDKKDIPGLLIEDINLQIIGKCK